MSSPILVIHMREWSVDYDVFKAIYEGKGYDIIDAANISDEELCRQISNHQRLVIIGLHNLGDIIVYDNVSRKYHPLLNGSHAKLLSSKKILSIGGQDYYEAHRIPGIHYRTIITSGFASYLYELGEYSDKDVKNIVMPLMKILGDLVEKDWSSNVEKEILERYNDSCPIAEFNRKNFIVI